jgi:magnesium-protoporphyrin O-methyltransferase
MAATHLSRQRRGQIETYFDRTACEAWEQLTSTRRWAASAPPCAPGATACAHAAVWLPPTCAAAHPRRRLRHRRAGVEAARRGADVVAIDLSPTLVDVARAAWRSPTTCAAAAASTSAVGDITDVALGDFDHVVAMDSLIHYSAEDACACCRAGPAHPRLDAVHLRAEHAAAAAMHAWAACSRAATARRRSCRWPRSALRRMLAPTRPGAAGARPHERIASGFYTSQAFELSSRPMNSLIQRRA